MFVVGVINTVAASSSSKVPLVVYSAQGYDHAMTAAFQKATGIPVKLDDNSTGPLLTQIEASKNNPNWGLLALVQSSAGIGAVLGDRQLVVKYLNPSRAGATYSPGRPPRRNPRPGGRRPRESRA